MRTLLVIVAVLFAAVPATAGEEAVVVLPFTGEEETVAGAAHDLITGALSTAGVRLVEREAVARILAEGHSTAEAARLLAATHMVSGSAAYAADQWRFSMTLVTVPSGEVLGAVVETCGDRELGETLSRAAKRLASMLTTAPSAGLREDPRALASLHYLRGLGFHRAGLQLEAVGELLEAQRLSVRFVETRYWMAAAYLALGEPTHAAIEARAFLAAAPEHALAEHARRLLLDAERAAADTPPPSPKPPSQTLLDRLSGTVDLNRKLEVLEEILALGDGAAPLLVRAVQEGWTEPHTHWVLEKLAALDAEAFLDSTLLAPERLHSTLYEKAALLLTPEKAVTLGRRLSSPLRNERELVSIAIGALFRTPGLADDARTALLDAVVRATESESPLLAQEAVALLAGLDFDEAVEVVAARVGNRALPPAHRAEILRNLLQVPMPRSDRLDDALLPLLDSESPVLLKQVLYSLVGSTDPKTKKIARERGAEIVSSWSYPGLAMELSRYLVFWNEVPGAAGLASAFLASEDAAKRCVGLAILRRLEPAAAVRRAWDLLADPNDRVRMWALASIRDLAPPGTAFQRLFGLWDELIDLSEPIPARDPLRSPYFMALRNTANRNMRQGLSRQIAGPAIRLEDGRETWKRWYSLWMERSDKMRKLVGAFKGAVPERQAELLEAMGRTGHFPALSEFYRSLPWQEQKVLEQAWRKALLAAARELGLPEDQLPDIDGEPRAFNYLPMKIQKHLTDHPAWKR